MKNILITGVSRGLGLKIAEVVLKEGNTVYGLSRTKTDEFEQLVQKYPEKGNPKLIRDLITNLNVEKTETMFWVNVFSPMVLTKYSIRNMIYNHVAGSIIHISSISVHTGYKGLAMYASTKGALEAFSKNTAREWGEKGIRSNAIVAGFMETSMSNTLNDDQKNRIYSRSSLKKSTTLDSVAETAFFLLSDKADSITGQNIFVDSGTI